MFENFLGDDFMKRRLKSSQFFLSGVATAVVALWSGLSVMPARGSITVTNALTYASVNVGGNIADDFGANLAGETRWVSLFGASSTTTSVFGNSGFSMQSTNVRTGDIFDDSLSYAEAEFTANSNMSYTASHVFFNSSGRQYLLGFLYDVTDSVYLYQGSEQHNGTATMTVGSNLGNEGNYFAGSLTGNLIAGHQYFWLGLGQTYVYPDTDNGAFAGGTHSLQFGSGSVPEPTMLSIWGSLGIIGLIFSGRRRIA